ncbi:hypothetical protein [Novosphingopyxis sp.]|uniref:hypothetical protein n=1 Tax=Novosphingopyxis sp. TaxID=2709690 RepID=UPI003B5B7D38
MKAEEDDMDRDVQRTEVDRNYDFFSRNLARFLPAHEGEYALLRHQEIVSFFSNAGDAYAQGAKQFRDGIFSIQEVDPEPVHLGLYSNASH